MPLYDFECVKCHARREIVFPTFEAAEKAEVRCTESAAHGLELKSCNGFMRRLSSFAAFVVKGFSEKNGYAGGQTKEVKVADKNVRVTVRS